VPREDLTKNLYSDDEEYDDDDDEDDEDYDEDDDTSKLGACGGLAQNKKQVNNDPYRISCYILNTGRFIRISAYSLFKKKKRFYFDLVLIP